MNVAILGGSFDPPHAAHLLMAAYLGTVADFDHVLIVPVFEHVFDKSLTAFEHRLRMCQLAFQNLPFVEVSPLEATLKRPNFTLHTLRAIKRAHPDWQLRLAVGADVLAESHKWHAFDEVLRLAPLLVFGRHGAMGPDGVSHLLPAISSTEIRALLANPATRSACKVEEVLPPSVREYIEEQGLYR
jgi:nicotinate-nucleotide adenylyltransferase